MYEGRKPSKSELDLIEYFINELQKAYDNRPFYIHKYWKPVLSFWNEEARPEEEILTLKQEIEIPKFDNSALLYLMKYLRRVLHFVYGASEGQKLYEEYTDYIEGPFEQAQKAEKLYLEGCRFDPVSRKWTYYNGTDVE